MPYLLLLELNIILIVFESYHRDILNRMTPNGRKNTLDPSYLHWISEQHLAIWKSSVFPWPFRRNQHIVIVICASLWLRQRKQCIKKNSHSDILFNISASY